MDYGPVQPLSDPEEHAKLVELLKGGGLVPVDVSVFPHTRATTTVEVTPPTPDWYSIQGLTSCRCRGSILLQSIEIGQRIVQRHVDLGAFNLGHLIPMPLGVFSRFDPVIITFDAIGREIDRFDLTLWCHVLPNTGTDGAGAVLRAFPSSGAMVKMLRLIKESAVDVEDDEIRALLDHYAAVL